MIFYRLSLYSILSKSLSILRAVQKTLGCRSWNELRWNIDELNCTVLEGIVFLVLENIFLKIKMNFSRNHSPNQSQSSFQFCKWYNLLATLIARVKFFKLYRCSIVTFIKIIKQTYVLEISFTSIELKNISLFNGFLSQNNGDFSTEIKRRSNIDEKRSHCIICFTPQICHRHHASQNMFD
jgi:hypothetical protein